MVPLLDPLDDATIIYPSKRKIRLYVDEGVLMQDFKQVGTVDVWKRDGLSRGYIYLDVGLKINDE